jgi:PKD repeat protein
MPRHSPRNAIGMQVLWLPLIILCWAIGASAASKSVAQSFWKASVTDASLTTDCAPESGVANIATSNDLLDIRKCTDFQGNITVTNSNLADFNLDGVKTVSGGIHIADSKALKVVSSTTLQAVSSLFLENLSSLTIIRLPSLNNITTLHMATLPALAECVITTGNMVSDVQGVVVLDTAVGSLDWLTWPVTRSLSVVANRHLTDFKIPYTRISPGSSYAISINGALRNIDVSALASIDGSLEINGNSTKNLTFQGLTSINGYVRLDGAFENLDMPALTEINGALRALAVGDGDILSFCDWLDSQPRLRGHYDCIGNSTHPTTASQTSAAPSVASPSSSSMTTQTSKDQASVPSTGLSTGAKVSIAVSIILAAVVSSAATLWFLRRHTRSKLQEITETNHKRSSSSTIDHELDGNSSRVEIGPAIERHELPEHETRGELEGDVLKGLYTGRLVAGKEGGAQRKDEEVFELPA